MALSKKSTNFNALKFILHIMKKLLLLSSLFFFISALQSQTRISLQSGENQLKVTNSTRSGLSLENRVAYIDVQLEKRTQGQHVELIMEGYQTTFNVGNPDLPVLNSLIEVPMDATVNVNVVGYNDVTLSLSDYDINKLIAPAQESVSKSADPNKIEYIKNETVYQTNAWFSNPMVRYHEVGIMRGVRLGRIEINPLAYNPVTGQLRIFNNMKIDITFQNADEAKTVELKSKYYSPAFTGLFAGLLNYQTPAKDLNIHGTPLKMVIISHRMFENTLIPFVEWKKKQGFNVIVRYTDETGLGTNTGIKSYLQSLYQAGTTENPAPSFVMLVGDHEQIPAFNGSSASHYTDLYFVTFDGASDRIPDMNIGRMSAKTVEQLQPLINKTLQYERYQMPDPSYLSNGLLIAGVDASNATLYGNGALNYIISAYFNSAHNINSTNIFYPASDGSGVPAQIIQLVNQGLAWGNYTAHCSPSGWADPSFEIGAISQLTENQKYGLFIGNCCQSSQFNNDVCFAEAITRAANKGAIGYIGGTNSTYWSEDYWWATGYGTVVQNPVPSNFGPGAYDALFHELLTNDNVYSTTQGQVNIAGCLAVEQSNSTRKLYYWEIYHLMGDPSLTPYIGAMPAMEPNYLATIPIGLNSLTITNLPSKAYVALTNNGEIKAAGFASTQGEIELTFESFTIPTDADLVITAPFYQPYIGTVNVIPSNSPFVVYINSQVVDNQGNDNGQLDYNETVDLTVTIKNVGTVDATNVVAALSTENPYVEILIPEVNVGSVNAETEVTLTNAFRIKTAKNIPDQTKINFILAASDGTNDPWITTFNITANAPVLQRLDAQLQELSGNNNGRIDPNETVRITIPVKNTGHATGYPISTSLWSNLVNVLVNDITTTSDALDANQTTNFVFDIVTLDNIPTGAPLTLQLNVNSDIWSFTDNLSYSIGLISENFETGNFLSYPWTFGGQSNWVMVNSPVYEGNNAAKSGTITHNQTSSMSVTMDIPSNGNISFYRKVDSESNYDKLFFKIDGTTVNGSGWSGNLDWQQFSYPVTAGNRTFTWEYSKDVSISTGQDAAWVDMIIFPGAAAISNQAPVFTSTDVTDAYANELYTALITANDPNNDTLRFNAIQLPQWLTLTDNEDGTATLSGTPTAQTAVENEQVVLSINDGFWVVNKVINITVHNLVSVPASHNLTDLKVYPNPVENTATLLFNLKQGGRTAIDVISLNGQVVKSLLNQPMASGSYQISFSVEDLNAGVYIVRLISGDILDKYYIVVK